MKVGILGTGAYATALSTALMTNNCNITMWTKFKDELENLEKTREARTLKGVHIDDSVKFTNDIIDCVSDKDIIFVAIPAAFIDDTFKLLEGQIDDTYHFCIASKGIEQETGLFLNQVIEKHIDTKNIAVISGPTFAIDIASNKPCALTLASTSEETRNRVDKALRSSYLKLRHTEDVIGVETCGAIKNVIALASGMLKGLGANDSTRAMLITEAVHDMKEIIDSFDGEPKTVLSYAGFGDLLLTCTSFKSRNFTYGALIGAKKSTEELEEYCKENTVEGLYTVKSIYKVLKDKKVRIPTIDLIYNICMNEESPETLLTFLIEKI